MKKPKGLLGSRLDFEFGAHKILANLGELNAENVIRATRCRGIDCSKVDRFLPNIHDAVSIQFTGLIQF